MKAPLYSILLIGLLLAVPTSPGGPPTAGGMQGPIDLDRALEIALLRNPDILRAQQEIERTRGLVMEVRAQALPGLAVTGSYQQQDPALLESGGAPTTGQGGGSAGFITQDKTWNIALQASQLLYAGGGVSSGIRGARYAQQAAFHEMANTIDLVMAEVKRQFYTVLLSKSLITVQEESVQLLEDQLQDQVNRFEAGAVPRFNVLRAEVALANAKPDLIRARNTYRISQFNLAKTMGLERQVGRTGEEILPIVGDLTVDPFQEPPLDDAIDLALINRPFLKAQRDNILVEVEQVRVAASGYFPTLEAVGGYEFRPSRFSDDLTDVINGWFFGFQGSWNIFDGMATAGKVRQAQARLESARINYDDSVQQVELEVQEAYSRLTEARELLVGQEKNVEQAAEALRLAEVRLDAGTATQLDLLDAQVALTTAQVTQLQARFEYNLALIDYELATASGAMYEYQTNTPLSPGGADR